MTGTLLHLADVASDELQRRRPISLRTHFMGVVLAATVPALILTFIVGNHASNLAASTDQQRRSDAAHAVAGAVTRTIDTVLASLSALAASDGLTPHGDLAAYAQRADLVTQSLGSAVRLRWAAPDVAPGQPRRDSGGDALTSQVLNTARVTVSDVFFTHDTFIPVAEVMVPVIRGGVGIAVVSTILSPDKLTKVLQAQSPRPDSLVLLLDSQGRVAATSRDTAKFSGQIFEPLPNAEWWLNAHETPPAITEVSALPGWKVLYSESLPSFDHALAKTILAAVVASLLSVGMASLLAGRFARPLRALTEQANNVAVGRERLPEPMRALRIAEFDQLRQGMGRADAVLRRRWAAERMALREARTGHELLVSVVNGTAESIYVKDLELRYVMVNRAALLSGPEPREEWQVLGRTTADLFAPELAKRIEEADRSVLATGLMSSFEQDYQLDDASSGVRWVSMTIAPWKDADDRVVGVVSVGRDITQSRLAEARMRALQADLLRATRLSAMGAMASGLAHELNQPLAAATNYLNASGRLLDCGLEGDVPAFAASRHAITAGAQQVLRAGAIVRRLRAFVDRGEAALQPEDIDHVLRETCELAQTDGISCNVGLRLDLSPSVGLAMIDRTQIQQVLLNLIRNAAEAIGSVVAAPEDHIEPGLITPSDRGEIVISAKIVSDVMCIDVSDTGPGLPPGIAERLFQPFVSSKRTGMGIGLAICRTIIEGHGGRLTAEANTPCGMVFRIALPALHAPGDST